MDNSNEQEMINAAQLAAAQEAEERVKSEIISLKKRGVALRMTVNSQAEKIQRLEAELAELKPAEDPTEEKENPNAEV